jgi:hypothetical protein
MQPRPKVPKTKANHFIFIITPLIFTSTRTLYQFQSSLKPSPVPQMRPLQLQTLWSTSFTNCFNLVNSD